MVIVGEFVGGAALGAAFGVLFDVVNDALDKPTAFRKILKNIKLTLDFLKPVVEVIGVHNMELGLPDEELKHLLIDMEEGVKLVRKSAKVHRWNCMKSYYMDQLVELDGSLKRQLSLLMVQGVRDGKETLILARKNEKELVKSARDVRESLVLAQKTTNQLTEIEGDGKDILVLAQKNTNQLSESAKDGKETLILARQNADQLIESARDRKETLVLAQNNTKQLTESAKDGKETLVLAQKNAEQLTESAKDGKKTLVLARKMKRMLKRIERLVTCTKKGKSRCRSRNGVSKENRTKAKRKEHLRVFSFAELTAATDNFRDSIGTASSDMMFKGWVDVETFAPSKFGTGMMVFIRRCTSTSIEKQGIDGMMTEVNILGRLSHPNLVKLLGYCFASETLLVYEFMQGGSLDTHLDERSPDKEPLSWDNRLKIAVGAARGLTFLHSSKIIHGNVKPSNILLDGNYDARISDLSLAKWGVVDRKLIRGTIGYTDPASMMTGHLYVKSDVYSFGVVLLQLLTGSKVIDSSRPEKQSYLVDWATPHLSYERELPRVMDARIKGQYSSPEALQTAVLTLKCLQKDPENRPSMKEVADELLHIQAMKEKPNQSEVTNTQPSSSSQ